MAMEVMLLYLLAVADLGQRATLLMESPQSRLDSSKGILYDRNDRQFCVRP